MEFNFHVTQRKIILGDAGENFDGNICETTDSYVRLRSDGTTRRRKMRNTEHEILQFVIGKVKPIYTTAEIAAADAVPAPQATFTQTAEQKESANGVNFNLHLLLLMYYCIYLQCMYVRTYPCRGDCCATTSCECLELTVRQFQKTTLPCGNACIPVHVPIKRTWIAYFSLYFFLFYMVHSNYKRSVIQDIIGLSRKFVTKGKILKGFYRIFTMTFCELLVSCMIALLKNFSSFLAIDRFKWFLHCPKMFCILSL